MTKTLEAGVHITRSNGQKRGARESRLALNPELQFDGIPPDMGGFQYGLQVRFPTSGIHSLEVFKKGLDHTGNLVIALCPVLLFVDPQCE